MYVCMYVCVCLCVCVCVCVYESANLMCAECLLFKGATAPFYDCDFPFQLRCVT